MLPALFAVNCTASLEFNLRGFVLLFYSNKLYHIGHNFTEINRVSLFFILHIKKNNYVAIFLCFFSVELGSYRDCRL